MTLTEWLIPVLAALFGGGGLAGLYKIYSDRRLNIESQEGKAKEVQSVSMTTVLSHLDTQVKTLQGRMDKAEERNRKLVRITQIQFAHILLLELNHPKPLPARPAEMEWVEPVIMSDRTET